VEARYCVVGGHETNYLKLDDHQNGFCASMEIGS